MPRSVVIFGNHPGHDLSRLDPLESNSQLDTQGWGEHVDHDQRATLLFRHSGWRRHRRLVAESLHRTGQSFNRRQSFADCGSHAYVMRSVEDPTKHRIAGSCCHDRFCLPCGKGRAHTIAGNLQEHVAKVTVRFLTLTVKTDNETLAESLAKLYRSFQALRRCKLWKRRVSGGIAILEVKRSDKHDRWHPHLHCLITGKFIDKFELSKQWHAITRDSYIVDIRKPKSDGDVMRYVCKYVSKPWNNTFINKPEHLDEAIATLKGRKLLLTFGGWRGLQLSPMPDPGAWEYVEPLSTLLERANRGNTEAIEIVESLGCKDLGSILPRPPPEPERPTLTPITTTQERLFSLW